MAGRLVVLDRAGRAKSKSFLLPSGMCTLGRSAACDIRVLLPTVSPHHATVTVHANQTVVRNVGSGSTLVNGAPVSVCALRHGDELTLGGRRLRWEYESPQEPRRSKTEPALALPTANVGRAARRGTLAAAPRAPDRDLQLALELRHRASMPASSGAGGKQVAIVQPQRRDTTNQNDGAGTGAAPPPARSPQPAPTPAPRKSGASARLHTPTKATLWIESRRGRARAASLRTATPLRLAVLRKALTPAARPRSHVTKIQAPRGIDQTKQAAIMLMTGHTAKAKLSPAGLGGRAPAFVAKRRSPGVRVARGSRRGAAHARDTPRDCTGAPGDATRNTDARLSGKRSVSVLEISDSARSPAPSPRKSALKSGAGPRTTGSIKFDLSNLGDQSSLAAEDEDLLMLTDEDAPQRYSHSPPAPSPRRAIHSRSSRMLESLGSPLRPALVSPSAEPASPRSLKSARGSAIVRRALDGSADSQASRRTREAYSVVDLVSLDSTSGSVYGSASPGERSSLGPALLGSSTPLPTTPRGSRAPPRSSRGPRAGRSRARPDDATTRTIGSIDDEYSPKSSRKSLGRTFSPGSRLDESIPSEAEDVSPAKSRRSRTSILSTSNLSSRCIPPESPRSDVSYDTSVMSGKTSTRASRGRLDESIPPVSPKDVSLDKSRKSRTTLSISNRKSLEKTLSPTKRGSRSRLDVSIPESPNDVSADELRKSRITILSTTTRSTRSLPIELSQSDVSLDSSAISQATALSAKSSQRNSPDKLRKSRATLSTSTRRTRSLPYESTRSEASLDKSRRSRRTPTASKRSTLALESSKSDVSLDSSKKSLQKTLSPKRGSRSRLDDGAPESPKVDVSPDKSRKSRASLSTSNRRTRSPPFESLRSEVTLDFSRKSQATALSTMKSPKDVSLDKSRKSRATLSASSRNTRSLALESSQNDISLDSSKKSLGKTFSPKRGSRSRLDDTGPPGSSKDNSPDKSRTTLSTSNRSGRYIPLESSQSDTSLDSSKKSLGKTLSPKRSSRGKIDEASVASPKKFSPNKSRKSRATLSTSNRRTRSLPHWSPRSVVSLDSSRRLRTIAPRSSGGDARPRLSAKSGTSPATSTPSAPAQSPKNVSSKSSRGTRKTLDTSSGAASPAGAVTPERRAEPADAGTPVLCIRSLLDASVGGPLAPSPSASPAHTRRTFAAARDAPRSARGQLRSKSLAAPGRHGDVTPTGAEEPSPEAVKHKHSSAKKSRSRRSIIDTLDDSGLVRHLFGSPVKRKLSQSMSEFSRRQRLEGPEPESPAAGPDASGARRPRACDPPGDSPRAPRGPQSPRARRSIHNDLSDVRGLKRTFAREPKDDLRRVSGVKRLFREDGPRDDLTDVRGVRDLFRRRAPRNELVDVSGVRDVMKARSPNDDLRDVRGVKRLYRRSKVPSSPNVSGVARLLEEPAPAELLFDELVGRPPVRATYSKTFVARSAAKPARRRRTRSLSVPVDVLVNNPEDWLRAELQKRASTANKSVSRALRQLATATVAGGSPSPAGRTRRSAADSYAAHTLPIKKRSLAAPTPRDARKRSLPLKKRALVHSTPVKGRAARADDTLARMSPIASDPAPVEAVVEDPVRESSPVVPASPKKKSKAGKTKTEDAVEKNEIVKPSPKKTRARRAEEAARGGRATRGKAASATKKQTSEKAKKTATPKRSPTPMRAPATKNVLPSPVKSPAPRRSAAAAKKPTVVAKKSRAVAADPASPAASRRTRARRPASSPAAADLAQAPRTGRAALVVPKPSPKLKPRAARAAAGASKPEPPKKSAAPARGKRATKLDAAGDAPEHVKTKVTPTSPAPRRKTRKTPPSPASQKRARGAAPAPEARKRRGPAPTPESKKARIAPPTPETKRTREAPPTPEPKRGRRAPANPEPEKARRAPSTSKPKTPPQPKKGRKVLAKPKISLAAPPGPEPERRRKPAAAATTGRRARPPSEGRKAPPTPEPNRGRRAPTTPRPDKSREAEPGARRGRDAAGAARAAAGRPAPRAPRRPVAAPNEAAEPKGQKVASPVVEESAPRGRKRKNDTATVEKKNEPSAKKARATRAAGPPPAAAPARGRRR